jgi:hypothetical protein
MFNTPHRHVRTPSSTSLLRSSADAARWPQKLAYSQVEEQLRKPPPPKLPRSFGLLQKAVDENAAGRGGGAVGGDPLRMSFNSVMLNIDATRSTDPWRMKKQDLMFLAGYAVVCFRGSFFPICL